MPSSSGSEEHHNLDGSIERTPSNSSSSAGSGFLSRKKRPSFGLKKTPFKGRSRSGGKAAKGSGEQSSKEEQQLGKINESAPPSTPSLAPPQDDASTSQQPQTITKTSSFIEADNHNNNKEHQDNAFLRALRGSTSMDSTDEKPDGTKSPTASSNEADNSFLRMMRGDQDSVASGENNVGKQSSMSGGRSEADNSFLSMMHSGGGSSGNINNRASSPEMATTAHASSYKDADNAFLSALQGASSNPTSTLTNTHRQKMATAASEASDYSSADVDFLAAIRDTPPPGAPPRSSDGGTSISSMDSSSPSYSKRQMLGVGKGKGDMPTLPVIMSTDNLSGASSPASNVANVEGPKDDMAYANAAFLGALQAASVPGQESAAGRGNVATTQSYPDGSFVMNHNSTSNKMKAKQRVAPPKSRHAGHGSAGGHHSEPPIVDTDTEFLMAVRGGLSSASYPSSIGKGYDSGTLVLNSPNNKGTKPPAKSDLESSNSAFMMAIHSRDDGEALNASAAGIIGEGDHEDVEGAKHVEEEVEDDIADEDIEGLTLPAQPYMERVLLPRPLFFGHVLPPRVTAEAASLAAAMAANTVADVSDMESGRDTPAIYQQRDSLTNVESESTAADDSSVVSNQSRSSVSSMAGGGTGGKRLESSIAPCCRNLEGALEVFGFGVNPFNTSDMFVKEEVEGVTDEEAEATAGPHPYISIYSPIWEEWAKAARAKSRRKKGKILDAIAEEEAAIRSVEDAKKAAEDAKKPKKKSRVMPPVSLGSSSGVRQRRAHKKSMSMDFMDCLSSSAPPSFGRTPTPPLGDNKEVANKAPQLEEKNNADNLFLQFARAETTDNNAADEREEQTDNAHLSLPNDAESLRKTTETSNVSPSKVDADNSFLQFPRAGTADAADGEALSKGAPPQSQPEESNNADNLFLQFARAGTTDNVATPTASPTDTPKVAPALQSQPVDNSADNLFLQFARAGTTDVAADDGPGGSFMGAPKASTKAPPSQPVDNSADNLFLQFARAGTTDNVAADDGAGGGTFVGKLKASSSQDTSADFSTDQFLQFARAGTADLGGGGDTSSAPPKSKGFAVPPPAMDAGTFVQAVKSSDAASDDDSIEAAEERTAVGLNDNISAAAAMLAGNGGVDDDEDVDDRGIGNSMFMAAGGGAKAANKYGRPYSNFEFFGGWTPKFGCDDPSLPQESDLGVFGTKEEEKRNTERRREREMIKEFAVPGIMPHVTCPTHVLDVDDSTSWNSRFTENDNSTENDNLGGSGRNGSNTMLISLDGNGSAAPTPDKGSSQPHQKSPLYEVSRIAWWNLPDSHNGGGASSSTPGGGKKSSNISNHSGSRQAPAPAAEVFPARDDPIPLDVQTNLWPPLNLIRENNLSGARSHTATPTARLLPHLSDRPPSVRHLQIDTTAVGFPKLGGEIEPLFCKLAIYHFEMSAEMTASSSRSARTTGTTRDSDSVSTSTSSYAPSPNMERCGRVTESLSFDVVQDRNVIQSCRNALWPYAKDDEEWQPTGESGIKESDDARSEGTSCGMFPLPANLSMSNLYAVIIVHKVIAENVEDIQPYYKPGRHDSPHGIDNLPNLRANAAKACDQYGQFTTPFAFGVVPLKHIIGDESPKIPVSRAVQIPLFKFDPERGPQSIFDHILLMLHPRAEPRGGKAASMTRGHALLVMRYFGYNGLHSILKKKSSLARERLVDFTGELQVKCKSEKDAGKGTKEKCPVLGETYVLSPWRNQYQVEPALFGGRYATETKIEGGRGEEKNAPKSLYAQEIAALPLERSVPESSSRSRSKSSNRSKYDGMLFHTNFCNELVCQPKILQECSKKNIVIKVELRELQWNENLNAEIALPVAPSIHNSRRGPWLVQEAFSSCAMGTPQFLDEFKIKLPLILGEFGHKKIGLLFTVYHFNTKAKKHTSSKHGNVDMPESGFSIERIGSGFLPLALENSPTCLLANGDHDVPINFRAAQLTDEKEIPTSPSPSAPQHKKRFSFDSISRHTRSWSSSSDNHEIQMSKSGEKESDELTVPPLYTDENYPVGSLALTRLQARTSDDTQEDDRTADEVSPQSATFIKGLRSVSSTGDLQLLGSHSESSLKDSFEKEMVLRVTIVAFSSVHPQNKTLADLFLTKPKPPREIVSADFNEPYAPWGKYRTEIIYRLKPERIPPFNFVGGALAETERKLLEPVVSLTKSSKCPHADLMAHLVRVVAQLWRTTVSGAGEPSILWASPESLIPLRLNAFATLLHTVSSASHHMAKVGLRQLDGHAEWDINALGKLLSMLFDEWAIFGGPLEDPQNVKIPSPRKSPINRPDILSNRAKTSTDNLTTSRRPNIIERYSSEESQKPIPQKFDVDAMLRSAITPQPNTFSTTTEMTQDSGIDPIDTTFTSGDAGFKVDSKNDFMSALTASSDNDREASAQTSESACAAVGPTTFTGRTAENLFKPAAARGPAANRRRYFTINSLATITENDTEDSRVGGRGPLGQRSSSSSKKGDLLDTELVLHPGAKKEKSRQMRVPQVDKPNNGTGPLSTLDSILPPTEKKQDNDDIPRSPEKQRTLLTDDGTIEMEGTAFLDSLSQRFSNGLPGKEMGGEERRVGAAHHRKTRSRCSIDWSLPPADMLLEKDQQIEELNRTRSGGVTPTVLPLSPIGSFPDDVSSDDDTTGNDSFSSLADNKNSSALSDGDASPKKEHPLKRHTRSVSKDVSKVVEAILLPDFADRMSDMKKDGDKMRWWPYVYEVIIYQWVALLDEQTKKGDVAGKKSEEAKSVDSAETGLSPIVVKYLSHAAKAARGATIRCAPFLLEIIKQSLSWRVDCVFRERKKRRPSVGETSCEDAVPPLVKVDEKIMSAMEQLITMLTDASIDSRNFDSYEYRKISIDVNDAVVRFIRDLFSILDVQLVHRLVLVYFSRFVTKEGKHWHDRDSKVTGLRCAWETTKLRLNAITLFVRFPGFMSVCIPVMESWALPVTSSPDAARRFFSDALEKINCLGLSEFTAPDGPISKEPITIPRMKPHWLAELCTDICLSATGHAEERIQFRASSLLFELFWRHSQQGRFTGNISVVASVFVPFVTKILGHIDYLSSLPARGQLRKDILPCALFVLQSAPTGIMRALWRKLAKRAEGKTLRSDSADKYGGIIGSGRGSVGHAAFSSLLPGGSQPSQINENFDMDEEADIFDMFGLLNLSLSTVEYEGMGNQVEENNGVVTECDEKSSWRREYLLSTRAKTAVNPRSRPLKYFQSNNGVGEIDNAEQVTTTDSRRWHAHDCSMVIINICRQIVREILGMLKPNSSAAEDSNEGNMSYAGISGSRSMSDIFLQPTSSSLDDSESSNLPEAHHEDGKAARMRKRLRKRKLETLTFAVTDTIILVRAAASVYLHALSMKQSDVVITKTLTAAVEIVKIFGFKLFISAIGETLQHWMRVILEHCGARRAELRVDACEFLNLLLRLTWESYGSFSRIRLPLLAVQSEVMERIVAKAARKYVSEQKRLGLSPIPLSNDSAEASLTPLWRTIDRLHNQSASRNLSFKSALARLAIKMKKVYRAYLAAHALAIVTRAESGHGGDVLPSQPNPYVQRTRVSVHRIVSNSSWFSKRFLGNQTSVTLDRSMIQTEAVEDSFLIAADVFSSTELPSHRVAWLQKLAEFHKMRGRFAEEATCRCNIYHTYREAAKQHDHIWASSPFLPWASNCLDGTNPGGEGHAVVSDFDYETENLSGGSGKQVDRGTAFRRIFYRAADSVRVRTGDWGAIGGGKYLFYGVTLKSEFDSPTPWYSHREIEENMVEEAEVSGDLYLRAGIVESSRYSWSLANQFYSETSNYARLAYVYRRLALVVTSQVPIIDVSNQLDLSSQIGRFYKVYFHGGAPDDLLHSQGSEGFIYRVPNGVQIKDFASRLESAIRCILPGKTVVDLLLDDGSPTMAPKSTGGKRTAGIGGAPIEPCKIKVTPLRPLFKIEDDEKCFRGTPEWFQLKAEEHDYDANVEGSARNSGTTFSSLHQRSPSTSTTNSLSSAGSVTMTSRRIHRSNVRKSSVSHHSPTHEFDKDGVNGELIGVDRFYFTQPMKKDPVRGFRDWLKVPKGRIAERSLRVTELQVENSFPACRTRQKIIHRAVFTQSPLEASVEAVSTWCSVLFRTVIATNGQGVLGGQRQQGLSADSAKLVMECIHSSGVKRIGITFLSVNAPPEESNMGAGMYSPYQTLGEEEIERVQTKLARMIVTFLELLHLLIARNRDVLLTVLQVRKRRGGDACSVASAATRAGSHYSSPLKRQHADRNIGDIGQSYMYDRSHSEIVGRSIVAENHMNHGHVSNFSDKTDSAIGVQSELQRGLASLVKALSPNLLDTLNNEVPRWMRSCIQDTYFKSGLYRQADIPIGEELYFNVDTSGDDERGSKSESSYAVPRSIRGSGHTYRDGSPSGSLCSGTSDRRLERTMSTASERPPTDSRSTHRRNASGTSYASLNRI